MTARHYVYCSTCPKFQEDNEIVRDISLQGGENLPRISVVLVTLNEEDNISRAILSVKPWVDEVIVVDMMSDDCTVERARALGASLFKHPRVGFVEPARTTAVGYASGEWVLILDADEMVSFPLSRELREIAESDRADVCRLPRLNHILGKPMLYGQHAPDQDPQVRFFKKNTLKFSDRIHSFPKPEPGTRVHTVKFRDNHAIYHFHAATASQLIDKMNRYTTTEADQMFRDGRIASVWRLLFLPPLASLRGYFFNQGWRDGWRGFYWACLMFFYQLTREAKNLQLSQCGPSSNNEVAYDREATQVLREYADASTSDSSWKEIKASSAAG
jgi:(heptosyl)LPS beta-1,4-glucosyltransferase